VLTGIALAAGGYALFSLQDAAVKWLVTSYAVPQILFVRSTVVVLVALGVGGGRRAVADVGRSRNKIAMVFRAAVILGAWSLFYTAAARLGLAELTTLYFAAPVIAVGLSALVLKERVDAARWGAVAAGFAGVVMAAGPMGSVSAGPALMALGAAACWGTSTVLVRWIGRSDSTLTQMLSSNALFATACLPALPWVWHSLDGFSFAIMIGLGLTGGLGQYLLFEGFRFAPASALAPIEYSGLVWAFLYGYAIWADIPQWNTFAGAALILAGSLALIWFEHRRARLTAEAVSAT
jgi:S-adenosylmethionine uptake transporter